MRNRIFRSLLVGAVIFSAGICYADPNPYFTIFGKNTRDETGSALACLGRYSNAATMDVIVGSPSSGNTGSVDVYVGPPPPGDVFSDAGTPGSGLLGFSVSAAGDIDGDDRPDGLYGQPGNNTTWLLRTISSSPVSSSIAGPQSNSRFGQAVGSLAQDVAPPAGVEFIVGAPQADSSTGSGPQAGGGEAYLYAFTFPLLPVATFSGQSPQEHMGASVASITDCDVPPDNKRDVIVGGIGNPNSAVPGVVRVYSSASTLILGEYFASAPGDGFGSAVANIGDIDGRGKEDFIAGLPNATDANATPRGKVRVYLAEDAVRDGAVENFTIDGPTNSQFGFSVAGLGDIDGDGLTEFAIGAPALNNNTGAVFVYGIRNGQPAKLYQFDGTTPQQRFGQRVTGLLPNGQACDLNSDSFADFGIGTLDDSSASDNGSAIFYQGALRSTPTPTPTPTVTPTPTPTPPVKVVPDKSSFDFIIDRNGNLSGENRFNREPENVSCTVQLFGRYSDCRLDKIGPIKLIATVKTTGRNISFAAAKLRKTRRPAPRNCYTYNLITHSTCDDGPEFRSNVAARILSCGASPPVTIGKWQDQLISKLGVQQGALQKR